jgi:predicted DsbA family dithiol-disulfide isomerase
MAAEKSIAIDVVSDVVCPWCYIGQKRLEAAIEALPDIDVTVHWRPYQLDPTIPPDGKDRRQYMLAKFGSEQRIGEIHARIEPLGAAEGIAFDFGAIKVAPNTLDAHRLIRWAANDGSEVQDRLVKALFGAYFEQGQNVGDRAVLVEAARAAGMDGAVVEAMLAAEADRAEVVAEIETASRMGITGVPCFLLERRYAVMGAQDSATLAEAIRQVVAAKARGELDAAE